MSLILFAAWIAAAQAADAPAAPPRPPRELRGALDEVRVNTDGIRTQVLAYKQQHGLWYACGTPEEAKARGKAFDRTRWDGGPCWTILAFDDPGLLRGGYWVATTPTGVEIHGVIDADGDGVYAEYVATQDRPAATITPADEY